MLKDRLAKDIYDFILQQNALAGDAYTEQAFAQALANHLKAKGLTYEHNPQRDDFGSQ